MKQDEELGTFEEVTRAIDEMETDPAGHCSVQMDDAVREAIVSATKTGKPAVVTIKLKVTPGPEGRVGLALTVDAKLPRRGAPGGRSDA